MKLILLAGAPGSGKSTQGHALMCMHAKFKHLSLKDFLYGKSNSSRKTEFLSAIRSIGIAV